MNPFEPALLEAGDEKCDFGVCVILEGRRGKSHKIVLEPGSFFSGKVELKEGALSGCLPEEGYKNVYLSLLYFLPEGGEVYSNKVRLRISEQR